MLLGSGAHVAKEGSPLEEAFPKNGVDKESDDNE
jgi:hypothetical protein